MLLMRVPVLPGRKGMLILMRVHESEWEVVNEGEVFDVMILRKMVKSERQKADAAFAELEKERTTTASSVEEAMAMILQLQKEKRSTEIQASQFQRMAEHKLGYDQYVIKSLEWMITQHESQRSYLEEQIEIYRKELKHHISDDELKKLEFDIYRNGSLVSSSEIESQALLDFQETLKLIAKKKKGEEEAEKSASEKDKSQKRRNRWDMSQ
ncbi:hypothetical protein Lal_00042095 [Lupinus albus]|nr:hypothetical protein Lal_00042095 [Lupinus albus]